MKLKIKESKWLRGEPNNSSLYRPEDGKMCCLGQILEQGGVSKDDMKNLGSPQSVNRCHISSPIRRLLLRQHDGDDTTLAMDAIDINDDVAITDRERIAKLKELFATKGVELEFVK